ncbi:hypothetical protein K2173_023106 [Erythroxylum novogranatense]|uniref:DUF4283 domain-containing protein n=1 Tax=Erythroxylum novogranatense TaxID=1862640 RepID=A0AAV8T8J3_9ROSI|nr:hypothetical protein K2173_023106 [Erythroxylum novogranatense]
MDGLRTSDRRPALGPSFWPSHAQITHAVVWIRIPNLPIVRYHPKILSSLGNLVGETVQIDEASMLAQRGRYTRMEVDINLTIPLKSSMELDSESLLITYEGFPQVCYNCDIVGQSPMSCFRTSHPAGEDVPPSATGSARETGSREMLGGVEQRRGDAMSNDAFKWARPEGDFLLSTWTKLAKA